MFDRFGRVLWLTGALLVASATVRCVSESPGVAVELIFAAPADSEAAAPAVTDAALFVIAAALVPCEEPLRASWRDLAGGVAHAHTDSSGSRTWLGGQRVDALSAAGTPLGLLSPPAVAYCALEVTFAPDDVSEADPREDPMVGRSLGVEGDYRRPDGSMGHYAVRTSQRQVELISFDAPLVLDEADDLARVTVSFDATAWAASMDFETSTAGQRQAALLDELHTHLAATIQLRKQTR